MRAKLWFGAATAAFMMAALAPPASAQEADQAGDASTTARLTAGETAAGEISPAGDADWYRLRVEPGQRYRLALDGVENAEGATIDPTLTVYDAEGNQLAFNDDNDGSLNSALQYAAAQAGDVFVEARGFSQEATGAYRLSVSASPIPPDDVGNDARTRGRIVSGRAAAGNIEYEGDVDWYRLSARTGQRYRISLAGAEGEAGLGDPLLRVRDSEGVELTSSDDSEGTLNSQLDFVPQSSGDVFLEAAGYGDSYTGAYSLNVVAERLPTDNTSGDIRTRGRIVPGQTIPAAIDYEGDRDWYRTRLIAGQSYRFTLASSGDTPLSDPLVKLYGADGEEIAMDDDGGEGFNSYLEFTAPTTGNYFIEAGSFGEGGAGGYTLTALDGDIPSDTSTDALLSADGDYREGVLGTSGDRDWYRVDLKEGQGLRVGLTSSEGGEALGDPLLVIYGPDGAELVRDDDGGEGLNAWLEFQATGQGAYFIEARGFTDDAQGRYTLSLTAGEIGNAADSAEYITANSEGRVSMINAEGDSDWFAIELIEGRPYRFAVEGAEPGPLPDPLLVLFDAQGAEVARDDDGGTGLNAYLTFASTTGGTYYAAVSGYEGGGTGRYLLRVTDTDVAGNLNTDEVLDPSADDRMSRVEMPGDLDSYRVELEAGVSYTIDVSGAGDNPLADPFLTILDGQGERVTSDDDSGDGLDARIRFTPEQSGSFLLQASGLGGSTGWYKISIVRQ